MKGEHQILAQGICSCPCDKQSSGTEPSWPFAWLVKNKHCTHSICISPFNMWAERKIHIGTDALFLSCSWHPPRFLSLPFAQWCHTRGKGLWLLIPVWWEQVYGCSWGLPNFLINLFTHNKGIHLSSHGP